MDRDRAPRGRGYRNVGDDSGGAIVEFIAITLLLLIPVVYLVVTASRVQAGILAAESASHDAARVIVVEGVRALERGSTHAQAMEAGMTRSQAVVTVNLENFGFTEEDARLAVLCSASPCLSLGSNVVTQVEVDVPLPGVPGFVGRHIPLVVTVTGTARAPVDGLAAES